MIKMKKLVSSGVPGSNEGYVRRGREFTAANEQRAKELERLGLAYRIEVKAEPKSLNKIDPPPSNKAAEAGPFVSVGGTTGVEEPVPSSLPDRPRRGRPPKSSKVDLLS